jgi:hypothetical protein
MSAPRTLTVMCFISYGLPMPTAYMRMYGEGEPEPPTPGGLPIHP